MKNPFKNLLPVDDYIPEDIDFKKLIKKYTDIGVEKDKIVITDNPSVCTYSITRKCLVGGKK